jgi:hypothetical protein
LRQRAQADAHAERRRTALGQARQDVCAAQPHRLARAAPQHADAENQQREAADDAAEGFAPVVGLHAQLIGFAALLAVGHTHLDATGGEVRGEAHHQRVFEARQHRQELTFADVSLHRFRTLRARERDRDRAARRGVRGRYRHDFDARR